MLNDIKLQAFILNLLFQLEAGMKCYDPASPNWDGLACSRIAPWARRFCTNLEVPETGDFDIATLHQTVGYKHKKCLDHVFRFAFVQTNLLKKHVGELRLG